MVILVRAPDLDRAQDTGLISAAELQENSSSLRPSNDDSVPCFED